MATRQTPAEYFHTEVNTLERPAQAPYSYPPSPVMRMPEINSTGIIIVGLVAVVGLVGLFAVLAFNGNRKCNC